MSREYAVSVGGLTLGGTGATTLMALRPSASLALEIMRLWISQSANVTSAQQRVQVVTQVTAFPTSAGHTPTKLKAGDPASGIVSGTAGAAGTVGVNATSEGGGARTILFEDAFNVINGWLWVPTPEERIILPASSASIFGMYFPVIPGTPTNWAWGCIYREIG